MRTPSHVPLFVLAVLVVASGCAGDNDSASGSETTAPVATTAPSDTLPAPDDPDAPWAKQLVGAWDALLAANETALDEYLEDFSGYTPEEVAAYRDLVSHPAIAQAVDAFPDAPADAVLAGLYDALTTTLEGELAAGSDAAGQIEANLDEYQSAAENGGHGDIGEIRESVAQARDEATRACLDLAAALAERDLATLDCIEGPGPDEEAAPADEIAAPPEFMGDAVKIVSTSDHSSDLPEGTFSVTVGADALGCAAGTWLDVELNDDGTELTTEYACTDGTRTGTMTMLQHYGAIEWRECVGGDGDFTNLSGGGVTVDFEVGDAVTTVTITGHVTNPDEPASPTETSESEPTAAANCVESMPERDVLGNGDALPLGCYHVPVLTAATVTTSELLAVAPNDAYRLGVRGKSWADDGSRNAMFLRTVGIIPPEEVGHHTRSHIGTHR